MKHQLHETPNLQGPTEISQVRELQVQLWHLQRCSFSDTTETEQPHWFKSNSYWFKKKINYRKIKDTYSVLIKYTLSII